MGMSTNSTGLETDLNSAMAEQGISDVSVTSVAPSATVTVQDPPADPSTSGTSGSTSGSTSGNTSGNTSNSSSKPTSPAGDSGGSTSEAVYGFSFSIFTVIVTVVGYLAW